jgi:hypothetical protein
VANGGNARDRRRMRRVVEGVLETYGLPMREEAQKKQTWIEFILKYLLATVTLVGFGYEFAKYSVIVASIAFLLASALFFRGFLAWCNTRWKRIALLAAALLSAQVFVWYDYDWIRDEWTPTFLYLVPSSDLIDCDRRAFFVNHSGLKDVQNVEIVVKDNASGALQMERYPEIEPGTQDPNAPRYIWVKPSHPWDETYSIVVAGRKFHSVQDMVLRSGKGQLQSAIEIKVDGRKEQVLSCRDSLLPASYALAHGAHNSCAKVMDIEPGLLNHLQPEVYGLEHPNGDYTIIRLRKLAPPSELDSQSEERHLTEYQRQIMTSRLSGYQGTKLHILYAGGPRTLAYASEFRDFFHSLKWSVDGPNFVPVGDERMVDLQVSLSDHYWNKPNPVAIDLLGSLEGVKHRQSGVYDGAVAPDLIVLWVGPKSPSPVKPDDCAPAVLRPRPGEPHTCEMPAQSSGTCPLPPQQ